MRLYIFVILYTSKRIFAFKLFATVLIQLTPLTPLTLFEGPSYMILPLSCFHVLLDLQQTVVNEYRMNIEMIMISAMSVCH